MALSIKNEALEASIRRLAAAKGETITGAIRLAVDNELARAEIAREQRLRDAWEETRKIQARIAALPRLAHTTDDDLYDEHGLPA